jgi:hypothetical protein
MMNMLNNQSRKTEKDSTSHYEIDVMLTILHCNMLQAMKLKVRTGRVSVLLKQKSCTTQGCFIIISFLVGFINEKQKYRTCRKRKKKQRL